MHTLREVDTFEELLLALEEQMNQNERTIVLDFGRCIDEGTAASLGKTGILNIDQIAMCPLKLYLMTGINDFLDYILPLVCKKKVTERKIKQQILENIKRVSSRKTKSTELGIIRDMTNTLSTRSAPLYHLFRRNKEADNACIVRVDVDNRNHFYMLQMLLYLHAKNKTAPARYFFVDPNGDIQKYAAFAALLSKYTTADHKLTAGANYITSTRNQNKAIVPRFYKNMA